MNGYLVHIPDELVIKHAIFDTYGMHKFVYSMFDVHRNEKELNSSVSSEINWLDVIHDDEGLKVLIHTRRAIRAIDGVDMKFKTVQTSYAHGTKLNMAILVNPAFRKGLDKDKRRSGNKGEMVVLKTPEAISEWFKRKSPLYGFNVEELQVKCVQDSIINKNKSFKHLTTSVLNGVITVTDSEKFENAMLFGIGRGRTFGCGLLQVDPVARG